MVIEPDEFKLKPLQPNDDKLNIDDDILAICLCCLICVIADVHLK